VFLYNKGLPTAFVQFADYGTNKLGSSEISGSHRRESLTVKRELRYSKVTGNVRIVKTVELNLADQV
jgi:hypothetical protein